MSLTAAEPDINRRIAALRDHPAWADLQAFWSSERERKSSNLGRKLLGGAELTQREVDYEHGYWRGVLAVLDTPDRAEHTVRKSEEGRR